MRRHFGVLHAVLPVVLLLAACADPVVAPPELRPRSVAASQGPQACLPDAKLIGRIALSTEDQPGTWWHLTRTGLDAANKPNYLAEINANFGTTYDNLPDAVAHLVAAVQPLDVNGNGLVCAYRGRGVVAVLGDPTLWLYTFVVRDDKHAQN